MRDLDQRPMMPRDPRRVTLPMLLAVLCTATGCQARTPPASPPALPPAGARASRAPIETALALLPSDTRSVVVAYSLERVLDGLGWAELQHDDPAAHRAIASKVTEITRMDLLDPALFDELGLARNRPFGLAAIDRGGLTLFFEVADARAFEAAMQDRATRVSPRPADTGEARVIALKDPAGFHVVVRDRFALFLSAASGEQTTALARRVAAIDPTQSLAASPAFQTAVGGLDTEDDAFAYVPLHMLLDDLPLWSGEAWPTLPLAFGVNLEPDAMQLRAVLAPAPQAPAGSDAAGSLLQRLLRPGPVPRLQHALETPTLAFASVHVDAVALAELPAGRALDRLFQDLGGVSFTREIAPLLAGEIGLAVVVSRDWPGEELAPTLDVQAVAALTDPDRAARLLQRALTHGTRSVAGDQHSGYRIESDQHKLLRMGIAGNYLYVSSDRGPTLAALDTDAHVAASGSAMPVEIRGEAAGHLVLHAARLAELLATSHLEMPPADNEHARDRETYRSVHGELTRAWSELQDLERRAQEARPGLLDATTGWGPWIARAEVGRDGRIKVAGSGSLGPGGTARALAYLAAAGTDGPVEPGTASLLDLVRARDRVRKHLRELPVQLDKNTVRRTIRSRLPSILHCYEVVLLRRPDVAGTVVVEFQIGPDGRVIRSQAAGVTEEVSTCVAKVVETLQFPPLTPEQPRVQVRYPFTFRPVDGTQASQPSP